jgi:hypothetical protein
VRHNAIDDLVTNAMGFDVKRLAYTENHVSVNTSSTSHPRSEDVATNAREWLNAARCLKVYNNSFIVQTIKLLLPTEPKFTYRGLTSGTCGQ